MNLADDSADISGGHGEDTAAEMPPMAGPNALRQPSDEPIDDDRNRHPLAH
ncbi:MAG: hypothetical protein ACK41W_04885 [Cyanobacteriota bacterium]